MRKLVLIVALLAASPVLAKGPPPHVARKVACNKGWHVYMKANSLQGIEGARQEYQRACMAGEIEPGVKGKGR